MKNLTGFKQLIIKTIIFLVLFIVVSGIIGPWVIGTKLLYEFNFFIYGNLGKMVLFSALVFFILTKDRILKIDKDKFNRLNLLYIASAFLFLPLFFNTANQLLLESSFVANLPLSLATHFLIIIIPAFLVLGVFGRKFLVKFVNLFRKELLLCLGLSTVFSISIFYIWKIWPYFSDIVLRAEYYLFSLSFQNVQIIPPRGLFVEKFAVNIGEACSGLDSIFLFTTLYLLIALLEWDSFNHKKLMLMFSFAIVGLFIINILRVYLLILSGILISPEIAAKLFHTYLGMLLFILYFILFFKFFYPWMKKN